MRYSIGTVMTRSVESVLPSATLEDAARKMRFRNVGILPVVEGPQREVIGVITDRDIVLRAVAGGLKTNATKVREVMTPKLISCYEDQEIAEVTQLMEKNMVHRIIVVDEKNCLAGIVSVSDIAAKAGREALSGHVLAKVSAA